MSDFPPFRRGKCCPFFHFAFFCLVRRLLPFFAVFLFLGSLFEKFFGSELLFLGVGVGLAFFGVFLPMFLLYFWRFAPESVWKNSFDVRSVVFWVRSLLLFVRHRLFFKRQRSGSNRTPPHAPFCFFLVVSPFWPCVLLSWLFLGVPFWAPRVFRILSERLLRPFLLDARRQGCFLSFLLCRFLFSLLCCLRLHTLF